MQESILIVGTGALATYFAARLAAAGCEVSMLGTWPEGLAALAAAGARIDDQAGQPVRVMRDLSNLNEIKTALILVKSFQTRRAGEQLASHLAKNGLAVTLQNGLGNDTDLAEILGARRVGRGITTIGVTLLSPGHVHLGGAGQVILENKPEMSSLMAMLRKADFQVEADDHIEGQIWGKLILNAAINPLTAVLQIKNGRLVDIPSAKELMRNIAAEAVSVAAAEGVSLPFTDVGTVLEEVVRRSGDNLSSMLQDVMRGGPTEIDAINGKIVQAGEKHRLQTPVNRFMWLLVKALTERGKISELCIG